MSTASTRTRRITRSRSRSRSISPTRASSTPAAHKVASTTTGGSSSSSSTKRQKQLTPVSEQPPTDQTDDIEDVDEGDAKIPTLERGDTNGHANGKHPTSSSSSDVLYDSTAYSQVDAEQNEASRDASDAVTPTVSTVIDDDLANFDMNASIQQQQERAMVVHSSANSTVYKENNGTDLVLYNPVKGELLDASYILAQRLGYASMYWRKIYEKFGTNLGIHVDVDKPQTQNRTPGAPPPRTYYNVRVGKNLGQSCKFIPRTFNTSVVVALPIVQGLSQYYGPPFGNIGTADNYSPPYGKYNEGKFKASVSTDVNSIPTDIQWGDPTRPDQSPCSQLAACMNWIRYAIDEPASQAYRKLFPDNMPFVYKGLGPEADRLFLSNRMYQRLTGGEDTTQRLVAFTAEGDYLTPGHRLKLQQELAWTLHQKNEGNAKHQKLMEVPGFRLRMKSDPEDSEEPIPFKSWRECHESVIDYTTDLFVPFISPTTVEKGEPSEANNNTIGFHPNYTLVAYLWLGKREWYNIQLLDRTDPCFSPSGFIKQLSEKNKSNDPPTPLTLEQGWALQTKNKLKEADEERIKKLKTLLQNESNKY